MKLTDEMYNKELPKSALEFFEMILNTEDLKLIGEKTGYSTNMVQKLLIYGTLKLLVRNKPIYIEAIKIAVKKGKKISQVLHEIK